MGLKLTRTWLIDRIENPMDYNNSDEAIEAFKLALAGMDSEPVAMPDDLIKRLAFDLVILGSREELMKDENEKRLFELVNIGTEIARAAMLKAGPVTGWIKCSERMPDETQPVITVAEGGVVQRTVYQFCDGVWVDWYEQYDEVKVDAFTHWMPLPAAPEQGV